MDITGNRFYFILSYGCQMNQSDSEHYAGQLEELGYGPTEDMEQADVILINTCCVRETAEDKTLGKIGELKHLKANNPDLIIAVTGCMAQEWQDRLFERAPHIDLVIGTHNIHKLIDMITERQAQGRHLLSADMGAPAFHDLPTKRFHKFFAWIPIMNGCNNFCTYCIVPYVRGREVSRPMDAVLEEVKQAAAGGYKEITLLGQNVNSYGKDLETPWDFADLLRELDKIEGDYLIRFMSSQPKDATPKLFDTMARSRHVAHQLHLPVQSGCDRVLRAMNRPYDRAKYLELITYARKVMPDLVLTSDVIIGFPGETEAEAMETVELVRQVEFDALFTFIFSPRPGTPAAKMDDPVPRSEKQKWFDTLCAVQNDISARLHARYVGQTLRVLVDGRTDDARWPLSARTAGGRLVHLVGDEDALGQYRQVRITDSNTWALFGEMV